MYKIKEIEMDRLSIVSEFIEVQNSILTYKIGDIENIVQKVINSNNFVQLMIGY